MDANSHQGTWLGRPTVLLDTTSNKRHVRCLVSKHDAVLI